MAVFQENPHHPDIQPKRSLTQRDIQFLRSLQTEMNTQSNMCNADPVFWVLKGSKKVQGSPDNYDTVYLCDENGNLAGSLEAAEAALKPNGWLNSLLAGRDIQVLRVELQQDKTLDLLLKQDHVSTMINVVSVEDLLEHLSDIDHHDGLDDAANNSNNDTLYLYYEKTEPEIYPDTLFLTHRDAQSHLMRYGYNYSEDAHAYAMTAVRSPQVEQLYDILRHVDLDALEATVLTKDERN